MNHAKPDAGGGAGKRLENHGQIGCEGGYTHHMLCAVCGDSRTWYMRQSLVSIAEQKPTYTTRPSWPGGGERNRGGSLHVYGEGWLDDSTFCVGAAAGFHHG